MRGRPTVPRVWVVEPRVLIADEQAPYMHETFRSMHRLCGNKGSPPELFGAISSKRPIRPEAPIVFVTTGVFTGKARSGDFLPGVDRIIIDEAHETIAQNPDVELAIAICRQQGVVVDYMSATVDTGSIPDLLGIDPDNVIVADKTRHPIYVSNVGKPMEDSIVEIVRELLIEQNRDSALLPPMGYPNRDTILSDLFDGEQRAHGLLIAINTVSGSRSDTAVIRKKLTTADLQKNGRRLDVLELSGEVNKDLRKKEAFERKRDEMESQCRPYVVIATSVIEMGVTIPTLDFVVTMDSGFTNVVVGDRTLPSLQPLPFNSLKQRLGRVGRRRAGVGLITRELGAAYTDFTPEQLNGNDLEYEPVRTPLSTSSLTQLAYYTFEQNWQTPDEVAVGLTELRLPSRAALMRPDRLKVLVDERRYLTSLGIADHEGLTEAGRSVSRWIGDGYLPYACRLQQAILSSEVDPLEVLFWLVALGASDISMSDLMIRQVVLDDQRGAPTQGFLNANELHPRNDLIAIFQLVCGLSSQYGRYLNEESSPLLSLHDAAFKRFELHCGALGLNAAKVRHLLSRVVEVAKRTMKMNRNNADNLREIFDTANIKDLSNISWPKLESIAVDRLESVVNDLPGRPIITLEAEKRGAGDAFFWALDGKRIGRAGGAVPRLDGEQMSAVRFHARLRLLQEANDGFWLDIVHHAEVGS